jgi:omega-amidase
MKPLRITLIQTSLHWEQPDKNREHFFSLINPLRKGSSDLILLPEMFSTGFTMNAAAVAEEMNGPTVQWMKKLANAKNAVLCGSVVIRESGKYYNRLIWMQPDGKYFSYDKRHLFRMAGEEKIYTPGTKRLIVNLKGWRICPLVCYDLRFPVWSRNQNDYDLLIYVANWPSRRKYAWKQLLVARAIENQCYVAGLNRTGKDGNKIPYPGNSLLLDPLGKIINKNHGAGQSMETVTLDGGMLEHLRKSFPVSMDQDEFKILSR